jgi:flagellar hook protein FlgE
MAVHRQQPRELAGRTSSTPPPPARPRFTARSSAAARSTSIPTAKLTGSTGTAVTLDRAGTGAVPSQNVQLDFEGMTALTTLDSALVMDNQDGFATGTLNGFDIGPNGVITGTFSNGQTKSLGQVAVAQFDNPEGLIDEGSNLYTTGANSGSPTIGAPLELNAGAVRSGSLELSNVDLSREFINLIISSTGFTAASRVITTSDQLLTELLNTTR